MDYSKEIEKIEEMVNSLQEIDSKKFQKSTDLMVKVVAMLLQKLEIELLTLQKFLKELNEESSDPLNS